MTRTVIQGDESPSPLREVSDYRRHLVNWAFTHLDPDTDRIVVVEPNPARHAALRELWRDWTHVEILEATILRGVEHLLAPEGVESMLRSADGGLVRAHHPDAQVVAVPVAYADLKTLATTAGDVALISLDARSAPATLVQSWDRIPASALSVELPEVPATRQAVATYAPRLRAAGWRPAGRAWGPAGSNALWHRPAGVRARASGDLAAARVAAGRLWVSLREGLPLGARGRALRLRVATVATGRGAEVLDPAFGLPHEPLQPEAVRLQVQGWAEIANRGGTWDLEPEAFGDPQATARACYDRFGVWPISFSYPGTLRPVTGPRAELISPMIPGFPYAFEDPSAYLATYERAALAVTHRKAGWDCFRHVEILAAGALPLMVDAEELPRYCMVHHPHRALREIIRRVRAGDGWPSEDAISAMRAHTERHLTSAAMAAYVLRSSGLGDAERILFVDSQHPAASDYQSTLTLIGLKQLLGSRVESMFPAPWIFRDDDSPTRQLYGRGFGYTHTVDPSARSQAEATTPVGAPLQDLELSAYDAVIVGSCSRNRELAEQLLRSLDPMRTVWIHGEDTPPLPDDVRWIRRSGVHAFIRAIEA